MDTSRVEPLVGLFTVPIIFKVYYKPLQVVATHLGTSITAAMAHMHVYALLYNDITYNYSYK